LIYVSVIHLLQYSSFFWGKAGMLNSFNLVQSFLQDATAGHADKRMHRHVDALHSMTGAIGALAIFWQFLQFAHQIIALDDVMLLLCYKKKKMHQIYYYWEL
jgi:hypothetical protein